MLASTGRPWLSIKIPGNRINLAETSWLRSIGGASAASAGSSGRWFSRSRMRLFWHGVLKSFIVQAMPRKPSKSSEGTGLASTETKNKKQFLSGPLCHDQVQIPSHFRADVDSSSSASRSCPQRKFLRASGLYMYSFAFASESPPAVPSRSL